MNNEKYYGVAPQSPSMNKSTIEVVVPSTGVWPGAVNIQYTIPFLTVFKNGRKLLSTDIVAINGTTANLNATQIAALVPGDEIVFVGEYAIPALANMVPLSGGVMGGPLALTSGSTVQTPAQFDNSQNIINSAFLQQALGNCGGAVAYLATGTQSITDFGKLIELNSSIAFTLTTMPFTGVPKGVSMTYANVGSAAVTIAAGAGMTFNMNTSGLSSITLQPYQIVTCIFDGVSFLVTGGYGIASISASGYQRMPSGLIIQYGQTPQLTASTSGTVTYPIAFPNNMYGVVAMGGATTGGVGPLGSNSLSSSKTSCTFWAGTNGALGGSYMAWGN